MNMNINIKIFKIYFNNINAERVLLVNSLLYNTSNLRKDRNAYLSVLAPNTNLPAF